MTLYELRDAGKRYGERTVLRGVKAEFAAGELVAVAGPNGAGKSTLLGIMAGLRGAYEGECLLQGKRVEQWARRALARRVAVVPQSVQVDFPFTAEQVVLMGRTPFCDGLFESPEDHAAVEEAMRVTDTLEFRGRDFRSLSGGEKQRVILASALAQQPKVLLLDEPTTYLDLQHQVSFFRIVRAQCEAGLLAIAVTHDLNIAAAYASRLLLLRNGELVQQGQPESVLTAEVLRSVFAVDAEVRQGREGRPWIVYG